MPSIEGAPLLASGPPDAHLVRVLPGGAPGTRRLRPAARLILPMSSKSTLTRSHRVTEQLWFKTRDKAHFCELCKSGEGGERIRFALRWLLGSPFEH